MHRALFIVGATASGKSELATEIAERCNAEIVSVDAFQIYQGLNILTAKPEPAVLGRAPHHLIGVLPLSEKNHVARYLEMAREALTAITQRGRPALLVGGTGLYIHALIHGLSPLPPAQPELRAALETEPLSELNARLRALDPETAQTIDRQNRRRVVRALEVCLVTGRKYSEAIKDRPEEHAAGRIRFQPIEENLPQGSLLDWDRKKLHLRIAQRIEQMFANGVVQEVGALHAEMLGPTASRTLGLTPIRALLRGEITERECRARLEATTRQYARRQCTWFRKYSPFQCVMMESQRSFRELAESILRGRIVRNNRG